jgi:dipeptidyl aminopeptidase/acylaminoacyl peptidase
MATRVGRAVAPYGSWPSPVDAAMVAAEDVGYHSVHADGTAICWLEQRPAEGGRNVVVRREPDGTGGPVDLLPAPWNARTRVHEYGGGACLVAGGTVWFSNFADQRLYRLDGDGRPRPLTPEPATPAADRYADLRLVGGAAGGELLVCVRERHEHGTVGNDLAALPADGSAAPWRLAGGRDFYAYPRPSPDGRRLAWIAWDFPNMPWDGTELWVADLGPGGRLGEPRLVAGGPAESILQPEWAPDGTLHFVSDRSGWWNLYRERDGRAEPLHQTDAEFGQPLWQLGYTTYAFLPDGRIACLLTRNAVDHLGLLDPASGELQPLELPYTSIRPYLAAAGGRLAMVAASPSRGSAVVALDLTSGALETLAEPGMTLDEADVSVPRAIEFATDGGRSAHAFYYPPANRAARAPDGERPPLLVQSHGGPTAHSSPRLDLRFQYFTSRGIAVVDVNYGGSTGYGRAYRQRLDGEWGVVDTADCVNAARHLVAAGEVDGRRLAIAGGSAGGYTTLCALTFTDDFAVGASYFGLADLEQFVGETHKFESRYLERLVGPWPEQAERYRARSPLRHADRLNRPMILLQGLEDEVVPPAQAEVMVAALRRGRIPFAYLAFGGEQHGFRQRENIQRSLEAELYFYARILGFELADPVPAVDIENLDR